MRMVDIILKKRAGVELSDAEIGFFINGLTDGSVPDYQASALAMAICFQGMGHRETAELTRAMMLSGEVADLSGIDGIVADKHSTGGVGDTTTLVVAPLVAACGVKIAKMSGRGLGHTGGTLDKLESIPGFNIEASPEKLVELVNKNGLAVVGQTGEFVPADKKLYALRDVTGTVESLPLITSSIMSKKLASGAQAIVLDVKAGGGAFMKTTDDAFALAREMVSIGVSLGRSVRALVTDMDQPLGMNIGNSLEVQEAVEILSGQHKGSPLYEVSLLLAEQLMVMTENAQDGAQARAKLLQALSSGAALRKFSDMIFAQGGDGNVCYNLSLLPQAREIVPVYAKTGGFVEHIDAEAIGSAAQLLGAGRKEKDDIIDHAVGLVMRKRVGERVEVGGELALLHVNDRRSLSQAAEMIEHALRIGEQPENRPLLLGMIREDGEERWI